MILSDCVVLAGADLQPWTCARLETDDRCITQLDLVQPVEAYPGRGVVVIPGLTNAHTHVGDSVAPDGATGLTLEAGFFRPDGYKYRMLAQQEREAHVAAMAAFLGYGRRTGTVRHFDFREQGLEGTRRLREASQRAGIDSVILGQFDQLPFTQAALDENVQPLSPEAIAEMVAILAEADGVSESTMNDLTEPAWGQLRDLTESLGKLRAIHCLESPTYRDVSLQRTGRGDLIRAIEGFSPHLIVHLTIASAEELDLLAAHDITCVLNPRANANLGLPLPPIRGLLERGVACLLGTDNGLLNSPNLFAELDFTYKVAKSQYGNAIDPDPRRILQMATSNVARLPGFGNTGCLEVGKAADLVMVDFSASHLCRSQHLAASLLTRVTPEDIKAVFRAPRAG